MNEVKGGRVNVPKAKLGHFDKYGNKLGFSSLPTDKIRKMTRSYTVIGPQTYFASEINRACEARPDVHFTFYNCAIYFDENIRMDGRYFLDNCFYQDAPLTCLVKPVSFKEAFNE